MGYEGLERRADMCNDEISGALSEIRTDVKWIVDSLTKLASTERVANVEGRLDRHLQSHDKKGSAIAMWFGIAVSLAVGIMACL